MPQTNAERVEWLHKRYEALSEIIEDRGLEMEYVAYEQKAAADGHPKVIGHDVWDLMLDTERDLNLFPYFHTVRLELLEKIRAMKEEEAAGTKQNWLSLKAIKEQFTAERIMSGTLILLEIGQSAGLFFREEIDRTPGM